MRKIIAKMLKMQAIYYIHKYQPKIVVVSGSVGKTSTTQAIATILSDKFTVRKTLHNYNSDVGVPCSIFARELPSNLINPFAWGWLLFRNSLNVMKKPKFSILILELGTDRPGEIVEFAWLQPDIAVVTAVASEHMEFFETIDAVAQEELSVAAFSDKTYVNKDMVDKSFLGYINTEQVFNYSRSDITNYNLLPEDLQVVGDHSIDAVAAGLTVGSELGMNNEELNRAAKKVISQPGRMKRLGGILNSVIIDDTYNSSPEAARAALDYLYSVETVERIALLGNMNELGSTSADEHTKIGEYCDPKKLSLVVTLGVDANRYTAVAAKEAGCRVLEAQTPYEAAEIIKQHLSNGKESYVLLKGSQNGVFAEEATKLLISNPSDKTYLVRQSPFWMKIKSKNFESV